MVSSIPGVIRHGRYLSESGAGEAVIGSLMAVNLKINPGDELTFLAQGIDGSLAAEVVEVVGIFSSGSNEIDRSIVQLPLQFFQSAFAMNDQAHTLVIKLVKLAELSKTEKRIEALLSTSRPQLVALRWDELVPGLKQAIELDVSSGWLFYISLILVVTFTILNTFLMSVLERTKEFGIMLSLGAKPSWISYLILLECTLLTLLGILAGILLGALVVLYFGKHGFSIPGSEELMKLWNLPAALYPKVTFSALIRGPLVILLAGVAAALYPALRVLALRPTEALRST
jgi:ABC-type lipoprotein release transport system permease subunit